MASRPRQAKSVEAPSIRERVGLLEAIVTGELNSNLRGNRGLIHRPRPWTESSRKVSRAVTVCMLSRRSSCACPSRTSWITLESSGTRRFADHALQRSGINRNRYNASRDSNVVQRGRNSWRQMVALGSESDPRHAPLTAARVFRFLPASTLSLLQPVGGGRMDQWIAHDGARPRQEALASPKGREGLGFVTRTLVSTAAFFQSEIAVLGSDHLVAPTGWRFVAKPQIYGKLPVRFPGALWQRFSNWLFERNLGRFLKNWDNCDS